MVRVHLSPPNPRRSKFMARHLPLFPLPRGIRTPQLHCHAPRQRFSSIHTPQGDGCFRPFLKRRCTLSRPHSSDLASYRSPSLSFLVLHLLFLHLNLHVCSSLHIASSLHLTSSPHHHFISLPLHIISSSRFLSTSSLHLASSPISMFFIAHLFHLLRLLQLMLLFIVVLHCHRPGDEHELVAIRRRSCRRNDVHVRRCARTRSHPRVSGALRRESTRKRRFLEVGRRRRTAERRTTKCETPWPWAWTPWDSTSKTDTWVRASANVKS